MRREEGERSRDQILGLLIDVEGRLLIEGSLIDSSRLGEVNELAVGEGTNMREIETERRDRPID
jgi:hypothetical protein